MGSNFNLFATAQELIVDRIWGDQSQPSKEAIDNWVEDVVEPLWDVVGYAWSTAYTIGNIMSDRSLPWAGGDYARYVEDAIKAGPEAFRFSAYRDAGLI